MVDYDMKQGKDGVYSVDNVVSQPSRKSKSGLLSKLGKAMRSGIAGAVALGSAYAVSMPQKASADIIYNISSQADIRQDINSYPGYSSPYYESQQIDFKDANGNLISGGLTNKVILLYVNDHGEPMSSQIIGGLTIQSGQSVTDSGWLWTRNDLQLVPGLNGGETATNGLYGGSYWAGGIDLNGNGTVGTYTLNDNGTWTLQFDPNEGMFHSGDPNLLPGQYSFALNGVSAHPEGGTGPVTIDSIDIFAPYVVPEPATTSLIATGIIAGLACRRRKSGNKS